MMRALNLLRSGLDLAFERVSHSFGDWAEPLAMARTLAEVRRQHDRPEIKRVDPETIAMAVAAFRKTGQLPRFADLKYVCLGAAAVDNDGSCLLAEEAPREALLARAETVAEPRRQLKCFQALLRSYWSFPLNGEHTPEAARVGLGILRAWLARRFVALDETRIRKPDWFVMLSLHAHLLTDEACARYVPSLLAGNGSALQLAVDDLALPSDSWVVEEAVLAAIRSAAALGDEDFRGALPRLLAVASGLAGVSVSAALAVRCLAQLLSRHARCSSVSVHLQLFDAALQIIGNPWLRRANWAAHVLDAKGGPDEPAREMVGAWLKHSLIRDFFELFGEDGDARRVDYWQRFDPFIEDMWFSLASPMRGAGGQRHDDFIRRAEGCLLDLDDVAEGRGLLIMRLGDFAAVEFAAKGKPFRLFRWESLVPALARPSGDGKARFSLRNLKATKLEARLEHRDSPERGVNWEEKFDEHMRPVIWRGG